MKRHDLLLTLSPRDLNPNVVRNPMDTDRAYQEENERWQRELEAYIVDDRTEALTDSDRDD